MGKRQKKRSITNQPNWKNEWGYKDTPFQKYDEAVIIPRVELYDGSHNSAPLDELKKIIKVGKTYKVKPQYLDKKLKAKLVAVYSDPIGFGNKGKNTDVRLKTEWEFQEPIGSFPKGKHETIDDINIEYALRSKKRATKKRVKGKKALTFAQKIKKEIAKEVDISQFD